MYNRTELKIFGSPPLRKFQPILSGINSKSQLLNPKLLSATHGKIYWHLENK